MGSSSSPTESHLILCLIIFPANSETIEVLGNVPVERVA
jgi:hypothetical protein